MVLWRGATTGKGVLGGSGLSSQRRKRPCSRGKAKLSFGDERI